MQINRLFEIVHILLNKKRVTAQALAEHFEVSRRTILRDIDTLAMGGIPVYATQGKGGGIFIQDSFVLNKALVSEAEQKQILFSLQSMPATEFIDTQQVLGRLKNFFATPAREWVEVDFSRWGHSAEDNGKFEMLKNAILSEQAVAFSYLSPYGETQWPVVFPLKLCFKSKTWYVQTFCPTEDDYRVFKLTRVNHIAMAGSTFVSSQYEIPPMDTVADTAPGECIAVRAFVSQNAKYRIYDEFAEGDITVNDDGTFTLQIPPNQWIYDYILSYGTAIEVLEPQYIRDELLNRIEKIKNKYLS